MPSPLPVPRPAAAPAPTGTPSVPAGRGASSAAAPEPTQAAPARPPASPLPPAPLPPAPLPPAPLPPSLPAAAATAPAAEAPPSPVPERMISFRPRSVLIVLGVLTAVAVGIGFIRLTSDGLTLIAIALFLALALNPAVEFFQRRGLGRLAAVAAVYVAALGVLTLLVVVFIPPMVLQVSNLVQAVPGFLDTLSDGHGPVGVLERRYQVVERLQSATTARDISTWTSAALSGLDVIRKIATSFVGAVLIAFLTLFMLLEGPAWRRRLTALLPETNRTTVERVGSGVYRSVGGFVTGNLLASLASGVFATVLLLLAGVPYALPLGLFVVLIDLVPYIGPAIVTVLLPAIALTQGPVRALVVFLALLAYHLVEGHTLRPLIYGRALKLSPLAVLIAIVLGTQLAGILGALAAIPVAGALQVLVLEVIRLRNERRDPTGASPG